MRLRDGERAVGVSPAALSPFWGGGGCAGVCGEGRARGQRDRGGGAPLVGGVRSVDPQSFFARTRPVAHAERFAMVAVRPSEREMAFRVAGSTEGFCMVLDVGREVTLLLPQQRWTRVQPVFMDAAVTAEFRVITLEADIDLDEVVYIATITATLAREGVPVAVLSAFSQEHLLVRDGDLARALTILQKAGAAAGRA